MKKIYLFALGTLLFSGQLSAQFNDDFENYTVGDYLGVASANWTTWSNAPGSNEDVKIVNNKAFSGSNSIYFASNSANGGPADVILPFGGVHNSGQFEFEAMFFVEANKGAYFNFQGSQTIGSIFSLQCFMNNNGELSITDADGEKLTTTYPTGVWFKLGFSINLNINNWEFFIDDVSQGSFQNKENKIASIDIYPVNSTDNGGNNAAGYWVDDVMYNHLPYTLPNTNAAVTSINIGQGIAGQQKNLQTSIRNLGVQTITSFDISFTYDGNTTTESVIGANITSFNFYNYIFTLPVTLVAGNNPITVTVSNINGNGADDDISDDSKSININPVIAAIGKKVVAEEGTGTWCGWCPRGAVSMDKMSTDYGDYFVGIAVHNNDPMTVTSYDSGLGNFMSGYPSAVVDRGSDIDPSAIEGEFIQNITTSPTAVLSNTAIFNSDTRELTVTVNSDFKQNASGDWKLVCVLTEDSVKGTGSGWAQSNNYAGGGAGVMGGFESLPNPVPASLMVYNHVARAINPDFTGKSNVYTSTINSGDVFNTEFTFTVDPTWKTNKMHIVSMLVNPNGKIDNAGSDIFADVTLTSINNNKNPLNYITLYPNPASDVANLIISSEKGEDVTIQIFNINGQLIASQNVTKSAGKQNLPLNTGNLSRGIYMIKVNMGHESLNKRLIIK